MGVFVSRGDDVAIVQLFKGGLGSRGHFLAGGNDIQIGVAARVWLLGGELFYSVVKYCPDMFAPRINGRSLSHVPKWGPGMDPAAVGGTHKGRQQLPGPLQLRCRSRMSPGQPWCSCR